MKSILDGIDVDVKITGTVVVDFTLDLDSFMLLPASVQKFILKQVNTRN